MMKLVVTPYKGGNFDYSISIVVKDIKVGKMDVTAQCGCWWIYNVHIFQKYRNKGYCTRAMSKLVRRKIFSDRPMALWVYTTNTHAFKAYIKAGFLIKSTSVSGDIYTMQFNR